MSSPEIDSGRVALAGLDAWRRRLAAVSRIVQRHLVPGFISTFYYLLRSRCFVNPKAQVQLTRRIRIGRGTVVKAFAVVQQSNNGVVEIGRDCAIGNFNHISASDGGLRIGDHVRMGPNVTILGMSNVTSRRDRLIVDQGYTSQGIDIGNDVFLAAGCTVLDGVTIGEGAVVGTGSIVRKDVAPYDIVFGAPAKKIFARG